MPRHPLEPHAQRHQAVMLAGEAQRLAVLLAVVEHVALIRFQHRARHFHRLGDAALGGPVEEEVQMCTRRSLWCIRSSCLHLPDLRGAFRAARPAECRRAAGLRAIYAYVRLRRHYAARYYAFLRFSEENAIWRLYSCGFQQAATPPPSHRFGAVLAPPSDLPTPTRFTFVHETLAPAAVMHDQVFHLLQAVQMDLQLRGAPAGVLAHVAAAKTKILVRP